MSIQAQERNGTGMRLTGNFQFDAPLEDSFAACAEAIEQLGWPVNALEPYRIVSYADTATMAHPPRIEIELQDSGDTTDIRIVGTDPAGDPDHQQALIAELDRVRDAIKVSAHGRSRLGRTPSVPNQPPPPPLNGANGGTAKSRRRGWVFWALTSLGGLLLLGGMGAGGFFVGQGTRLSDEQVEARVASQARFDRIHYVGQRKAALTEQRENMQRKFDQRLDEETAEARAEGEAAGYSSGHSAGYASGESEGYDQGYEEGDLNGYVDGFDVGTCYDPYTYEYVC